MLAFLYTNPMVVIFIVSVILLILMYYYFKSLSVKGKPKEEKKESAEQKVEEPKEEKSEETKTDEPEKKEQEEPVEEEPESTIGRGGKKSRVTQIYRRPVQKSESDVVEKNEDVGDYQADFVDVSKNVSKFKTLKQEDFGDVQAEPIVDEYGFVAETKEDCDFCEDKVKHFDHSRRLSNFVRDNNFDGMFGSHLSDYYMFSDNIDKHLNLTEENLSHLYEKATETIENSKKRVISGAIREGVAEAIVESDRQNIDSEEDLSSKVDLRNIVLTDSIMNRKKKK